MTGTDVAAYLRRLGLGTPLHPGVDALHRLHAAHVENRVLPEPPGAVLANHLALTVQGLPTDECPSGDWLVDAGLGDALHVPLPLHEGTYRQGPFRFTMRPSDVEPGGWRFDHDPAGNFAGMDFAPGPATVDDFT